MLTRIDLFTQLFTDLISQKGYSIRIDFSVICPCVDPATGRPVSNCVECDGRGNYYYDSVVTKGNITRLNKEVQLADNIGSLDPGSSYLTLPHDTFISVNDKVTNLDSTAQFSEALLHNVNGDYLRYPPVGNILYAAIQNSSSSPVIPLVQGTDYSVDSSSGRVTWMGDVGGAIAEGQGVSFRYYYNPVWIVYDIINYVRDTRVKNLMPVDTFKNLPIRCLMRLDYLGASK